jgi:antirestriction protein ArdC
MAQKTDVYQKITDKIITYLEEGTRPWFKPWNAEHAAGRITRPLKHDFEPYNGINILNLWMEAEERGLSAPVWMTFKQAKDLGGSVKKGEKGSLSVYANTFKKTEMDESTGEEIEQNIPFMKGYTVFNVEQIEDLPDKYYELAKEPEITPEQRIEAIEQFFLNTGANIKEGGNRAYYAIGLDHIQMPPFVSFETAENYYSTLSHETTHWTRHPTRLDRDLGRKKWGDEGYAMEELVAELGSAYICADLGLAPDVREENAAYIEHWLKVLKGDKRAIFSAAAHAQRAAELLHEYQESPAPALNAKAEPEEKLSIEEQPDEQRINSTGAMRQLDIFDNDLSM